MKQRTERRIWESAKLTRGIISILIVLFVAGTTITIQNLAEELKVSAEVDTENLSNHLTNLTAEQRNTTDRLDSIAWELENATKSWHLAYSGQTTGDWMGPFPIFGEEAIISWIPTEGTIQSGETAQFCYAQNRTCFGLYLQVGMIGTYDISNGGELNQGWYYLHYTPMTGTNKTIDVFLYH
ncbi:MAG: hypothetical protein ACE5KV_07040 [Thermoplasmata archaeon]